MRKHLLPSSIAALLFLPATGHAELISTTVTLTGYYDWTVGTVDCATSIDFSSQSLVSCHSASGDLYYYQRESDGRLVFHGSAQPSDTPYEEATRAPTDGYNKDNLVDANKTYFLKTSDGMYARMIVRTIRGDCECLDIEYVVQTDGTRALGPALAVMPATWGKIKALYR